MASVMSRGKSRSCKIWRTAHVLADSDMVSPHYRCGYQVPLGLVAVAGLEQHLLDIEMCSFHYAVGVKVVT